MVGTALRAVRPPSKTHLVLFGSFSSKRRSNQSIKQFSPPTASCNVCSEGSIFNPPAYFCRVASSHARQCQAAGLMGIAAERQSLGKQPGLMLVNKSRKCRAISFPRASDKIGGFVQVCGRRGHSELPYLNDLESPSGSLFLGGFEVRSLSHPDDSPAAPGANFSDSFPN